MPTNNLRRDTFAHFAGKQLIQWFAVQNTLNKDVALFVLVGVVQGIVINGFGKVGMEVIGKQNRPVKSLAGCGAQIDVLSVMIYNQTVFTVCGKYIAHREAFFLYFYGSRGIFRTYNVVKKMERQKQWQDVKQENVAVAPESSAMQ